MKESWLRYDGVCLLAGLGWLAHDRELVDPGHRGAPDGPVDRLPARSVLAQTGDDVRGGSMPAVLPYALGLDHPLFPIAGPVALAEAPLGVEDPGLELVPLPGPSRSAACRSGPSGPGSSS